MLTPVPVHPGAVVQLRQRRWIVENVAPPPKYGEAHLVDVACLDDDAQGQTAQVLWEYEPDARVLDAEAWGQLGGKGFDPPEVFASYLNTRRWNCVTATDPALFQAPFRAGIRIEAYQLEPLRLATTRDSDLIAAFARDFRERHWRGGRLPPVYFDPRGLALAPSERAVLHAKCIVIDRTRALVTSANLTPAAHERNVELGVLVSAGALPGRIADHFAALARSGALAPIW